VPILWRTFAIALCLLSVLCFALTFLVGYFLLSCDQIFPVLRLIFPCPLAYFSFPVAGTGLYVTGVADLDPYLLRLGLPNPDLDLL
jgi:hypothetical protein